MKKGAVVESEQNNYEFFLKKAGRRSWHADFAPALQCMSACLFCREYCKLPLLSLSSALVSL